MLPELKEKWVKALRSGEFQQGKGELKNDAGQYCCLGVLCMVGREDGLDRVTGTWLEPDIRDEFGLSEKHHTECMNMNDGAMGDDSKTFAEIADYIEANL